MSIHWRRRQLHIPLFLQHHQWQDYKVSADQRVRQVVSYMGHYTHNRVGCYRGRSGDFDHVENIGHDAAEAWMRQIQWGKEKGCLGNGKHLEYLFYQQTLNKNCFQNLERESIVQVGDVKVCQPLIQECQIDQLKQCSMF